MTKRKRTRAGKEDVEGRSIKPMTFNINGPKRFFRYPDSVHILEFRVIEFDMERYHNSVPITLAELVELRNKIDEWIGSWTNEPYQETSQ